MKNKYHYLVTSEHSFYSAIITGVSYKDVKDYNDSTPGLRGTLTRIDMATFKQPAFFLGVHVTPKLKERGRTENMAKGIY
jgi:hypothetical protein